MLSLYRRYLDAKEKIKSMMTDDEGQTVVEYVLIVAVISLIILAGSPSIANHLGNLINTISAKISTAPVAGS